MAEISDLACAYGRLCSRRRASWHAQLNGSGLDCSSAASDVARNRACGEGVAHRAEGFLAEISRGLLSLFAEWFCPSPKHANDVAPPQLADFDEYLSRLSY